MQRLDMIACYESFDFLVALLSPLLSPLAQSPIVGLILSCFFLMTTSRQFSFIRALRT